jgi:hypothetical protein
VTEDDTAPPANSGKRLRSQTKVSDADPIRLSSAGTGGIFDGGFETYLPVTDDDYRRLLTSGLVVLDTNALLDLYRYHAHTRVELIDILTRMKDRLWIPYYVLAEFFERRLSVIEGHAREVDEIVDNLDKHGASLESLIRTWGNRGGLPEDRVAEIVNGIRQGIDSATDTIRELSTENRLGQAEDTEKDPVVKTLSSILGGRVGDPLLGGELAEAKRIARQRIADKIPPGWKDANKRSNSEGDYLIWLQTLQEARRRAVDVLFVTGDVKEDWWRKEHGEVRGPLPELVHEMRQVAHVRLFMLRPESLLVHAGEVLGIRVSEASVQDVERVTSSASTATIHVWQTQIRSDVRRLADAMKSLESHDPGTNTSTLLSLPVQELADTVVKRIFLLDVLGAVWPVIGVGIKNGIFGGTATWQVSQWEQEALAALDAVYISAVHAWLEAEARRQARKLRIEPDINPDQLFWRDLLPPGISRVDVRKSVQNSRDVNYVQFIVRIIDGRLVRYYIRHSA